MHKTVVQISGNNAPKERTITRTASTTASRRFVSNNGNSNRLTVTNDRQYKDIRNADLEKSRSLDSEYERYQGNSRTEFDKSRSFDENYSDQVPQSKYLDYPNAIRQPVPTKLGSPQNYGNRFHDTELIYDKSRKSLTRSPLMSHKHDPKASHAKHQQIRGGKREGERSPNLNRENVYRSMTKSFDHLQSAIPMQQIQSTSVQSIRDHSPTKRIHGNSHISALAKTTSPSSDYDLNASDFNVSYDIRSNGKSDILSKEAKLRSEYYFGSKANLESYLNQRRRETAKASIAPSARYLRN